jgi:hypothetical protein
MKRPTPHISHRRSRRHSFASKMLLKSILKNIYTLNNPKKELKQKNIDVVLLDMNYRIGFEDGRVCIY